MIERIQKRRRILFFLVLVLLVSQTFSALAAGASISFTVSQTFIISGSSAAEIKDNFLYKLTAQKENNPMPAGGKKEFSFSLKSNETFTLPAIDFHQTGIYHYQIEQIISQPLENYVYDEEKYGIEVHVKNDGQGGLTTQAINRNHKGEKVEALNFSNSYKGIHEEPKPTTAPTQKPPKESLPKTGDESNIVLWVVLASIAGLTMLSLLRFYHKRGKRQ